jgi:hypothetical protein
LSDRVFSTIEQLHALQENSAVVLKDAPFSSWEQSAFSKLSLGFQPSYLTCLGLVDSPWEEASLGDRLCRLVVRLAAKEWEPLVDSCKPQWEEA